MQQKMAEPLLGATSKLRKHCPMRHQLLTACHKDIVGHVRETTEQEAEHALNTANDAGTIWFATPPERAAILLRAADLMEQQLQPLLDILVREAGKTYNNAIAEVRKR